MWTFLALLIAAVHIAFFAGFFYLTWHHKYWEKRGFVTAKPLTLLGTYQGVLTGKSNLICDVQKVYNKYKNNYRAVGVFFTRQPQILVLDPQLAHDVLVKNFSDYRDTVTSSFVGHLKADKYVMRNPFFSTGEDWKKRRVDCGTGITSNKLKQAYAIWQHSAQKLLKHMERFIEQRGDVIETKQLCYRYTADAMADFIWGIDARSLTSEFDEPNQFQEVATKWVSTAFQHFVTFNKSIVAPIARKVLQMRFYPQDTDDFYSKLTQDALKLRSSGADRSDYLSHLKQLMEQKGNSHDDVVGHALTVLLDGFETSSALLYHLLYTFGEYKVEQQKLRAEILEALGPDKQISYDQLMALPYLDQCVNESMRLTSPIGTLTKICTKATTIEFEEGKSVQVEQGITIMLPAYHFHHDDAYFPEAETFKPERFENGVSQEFTKRGFFLPFGDGPRICLGMRMTLLNIKMAAVSILSEYEVSQTKKVPMNSDSGLGIALDGDIDLKYTKLS